MLVIFYILSGVNILLLVNNWLAVKNLQILGAIYNRCKFATKDMDEHSYFARLEEKVSDISSTVGASIGAGILIWCISTMLYMTSMENLLLVIFQGVLSATLILMYLYYLDRKGTIQPYSLDTMLEVKSVNLTSQKSLKNTYLRSTPTT